MRKVFIIFLTIILTLCSFNAVIAQEKPIDPVSGIRVELDKIESYVAQNKTNEAKEHLEKLREYVYAWASELTEKNLYTIRVLDIVHLSAVAIEKNDTEFVVRARRVLDEIISGRIIIVSDDSHS